MTAPSPRVLATRLDNAGDVLLTGPAVRVLAAQARVTMLAGPRGAAAARLLPGVDEVLTYACPWIDADAPPVEAEALDDLVAVLRARRFDAAAIFGSSHQSPLPTALLARLAGIGEIAAVSHEYPGSLLDHRIPGDPDLHEVERHLAVAAELGYRPAPGEDLSLAVDRASIVPSPVDGRYVVVHPGATVPARTLAPERWVGVVAALAHAGYAVVVTGGPSEVALAEHVAGHQGRVLAGTLSVAELAGVLDGADVVVTGNTGPMHLAAAVATPVVAVFAPTVPAERWRPWAVPHVLLGDQEIECAGCRSRTCPRPHQLCLDSVSAQAIEQAVASLAPPPVPSPSPSSSPRLAPHP